MKIKIAVSYDFFATPKEYVDGHDHLEVAAAIYRQYPKIGSKRAVKAADQLLDEIRKNQKEGRGGRVVRIDMPDTPYSDSLYGLTVIGRPSRRIW